MAKSKSSNVNKRIFPSGLSLLMTDHVFTQQEVFEELVNIGVEIQLCYKGIYFPYCEILGGFEPCFVARNPAEERKEFSLQMVCNSCEKMGREELLSLGVRLEEGRDLYIR
ncbi:hypothetical protein V6N13_120143 [Hibiscus sabdariffa]